MNGSETVELEIVVRIPAELEQYRNALGASLFYLALGVAPAEHLPTDSCKPSRIKLSGAAITYLDRLTPRFGSRRQTIINALAWVSTQDTSRRALLAKTVI